jgi:hypothetical protein
MKTRKQILRKTGTWYTLRNRKGQEMSVLLNEDGTLDVACEQDGGRALILEPLGMYLKVHPQRANTQAEPPARRK